MKVTQSQQMQYIRALALIILAVPFLWAYVNYILPALLWCAVFYPGPSALVVGFAALYSLLRTFRS